MKCAMRFTDAVATQPKQRLKKFKRGKSLQGMESYLLQVNVKMSVSVIAEHMSFQTKSLISCLFSPIPSSSTLSLCMRPRVI